MGRKRRDITVRSTAHALRQPATGDVSEAGQKYDHYRGECEGTEEESASRAFFASLDVGGKRFVTLPEIDR